MDCATGGARWQGGQKTNWTRPPSAGGSASRGGALRLNQREFASRAGIATNTYGQYETGTRLISPKRAVDLCEQYGLTLDWIYRGDPGNLPYRLAAAIKALSELDNEA